MVDDVCDIYENLWLIGLFLNCVAKMKFLGVQLNQLIDHLSC